MKKLQKKRRSNGRKSLQRILRQHLHQKRKLKRSKGRKDTSAGKHNEGAKEGRKIEDATENDINVQTYVGKESKKQMFINKISDTTLKVKIKMN